MAPQQAVVNDEILVAGLRRSRYAALQAGYMANTPDKRLQTSRGSSANVPGKVADKAAMSVRSDSL